jgi:hypothetical protein
MIGDGARRVVFFSTTQLYRRRPCASADQLRNFVARFFLELRSAMKVFPIEPEARINAKAVRGSTKEN